MKLPTRVLRTSSTSLSKLFRSMLMKIRENRVTCGSFLLLVAIPSIFWGRHYGHRAMYIGGDYPGILFSDPLNFIRTSLHVNFQSLNGAVVFSQYWSIAMISLIFKTVGLGPQLALDGIILGLTFLGVSQLTKEILRSVNGSMSRYSSYVAGLVSVLAPLTGQVMFGSYVPGIVLMAFCPWALVFLIKFIDTSKNKYLIFGGIAVFFASSGIVDITFALPCLIFMFLFLFVIFWTKKYKLINFTLRGLKFIAILLLLNLVWILPWMLFQISLSQLQLNIDYSGATNLTSYLSHYSSVLDSIQLKQSALFLKTFDLVGFELSKWYTQLPLIGFLPALVVFIGYAVESIRGQEDHERSPLVLSLVTSTIFLGFLTLQFPPGSLKVFTWLERNVPIFISDRNFYIYFVIPFVISSAITVGFSFDSIIRRMGVKTIATLTVLFSCLYSLYGFPLLNGSHFYGWPNHGLITSLPRGYQEATKVIEKQSGVVLSLPLLGTSSNWTYLIGPVKKSVPYIGLSPLTFNSGIANYANLASFMDVNNAEIGNDASRFVLAADSKSFAKEILLLNIKWILVDYSALKQKSLYDFAALKTPVKNLDFIKSLLSELSAEVIHRSDGFTLYRLPSHFVQNQIEIVSQKSKQTFLSGSNTISQNISCSNMHLKRNGSQISILKTIEQATSSNHCLLVIQTPYSSSFSMRIQQNSTVRLDIASKLFGYQNSFLLPRLAPGEYTVQIIDNNDSRYKTSLIFSSSIFFTTVLLMYWKPIHRRLVIKH